MCLKNVYILALFESQHYFIIYSRMNTIDKIKKNKREQPYHVPLKVRVIKKTDTKYYQNGGKQRNATTLGLADITGAIQGICYDDQKLHMLQENSDIMLRNYIYRDDKIIITSQTIVARTSAVGDIREDILQYAVSIVMPRDSQNHTIASAKTLGMGQQISVTAKIIRVSTSCNIFFIKFFLFLCFLQS